MQLSLLDFTPPVEQPPPAPKSSPVRCVWRLLNGEWRYTGQMGMEHALKLKAGDITLSVGEVPQTAPQDEPQAPHPNADAIAHWELKLKLYQSIVTALTTKLTDGSQQHVQRMRQHEINRLESLCIDCKNTIKELSQ